jgi:hypothetical protein
MILLFEVLLKPHIKSHGGFTERLLKRRGKVAAGRGSVERVVSENSIGLRRPPVIVLE